MQDKDFDELFRGKLDNFEMQPSAKLWEGIDRELSADKRRKLYIPFLSVAASIVVLITAGVFFIPKVGNVTVKNPDKGTLAIVPKIDSAVSPTIKTQEPAALPKQAQSQLAVVSVKHTEPKQPSNERAVEPNKITANAEQSATQNTDTQQQLLASTPVKPQEITAHIVADHDIPQGVKAPDVVPVAVAKTPEPIVAQQPINASQSPTPDKPRRKAHTLGGLLNLAIAKVDKRADKVIVFAENDDEESDVTGINLGIVKIKKEK